MRFTSTVALLALFAAAAAKNITDPKTQALTAFYAVDDDIDKKRHVLRQEGAKKAVGYLLNQTAYLLKNKTAATEEFVAYGTTKIDDAKGLLRHKKGRESGSGRGGERMEHVLLRLVGAHAHPTLLSYHQALSAASPCPARSKSSKVRSCGCFCN